MNKIDKISEAISKEIKWCEENKAPSDVSKKDFIKGLKQALHIVAQIKNWE